jgi:hypothetical protein
MERTSGEMNLQTLIKNMEPILNDGEYVFVSLSSIESIPNDMIISTMREKEGMTVVLSKSDAESRDLKYEFVAAWISLNIHSSLEAVGLTAAFSSELGKGDISCNVIAGYYHDHIFVDTEDKEKAMEILLSMTR